MSLCWIIIFGIFLGKKTDYSSTSKPQTSDKLEESSMDIDYGVKLFIW